MRTFRKEWQAGDRSPEGTELGERGHDAPRPHPEGKKGKARVFSFAKVSKTYPGSHREDL